MTPRYRHHRLPPHHDEGKELRELFKALTKLVNAAVKWLKDFGHPECPKGQLVFRSGAPTPKTIKGK